MVLSAAGHYYYLNKNLNYVKQIFFCFMYVH